MERYLPHTSDDDDSVYRDRAEIEEARLRDPLEKLRELLSSTGLLSDEKDVELREAAKDEVNAATDAAESAPFPDAADVFEGVTAGSVPPRLPGRILPLFPRLRGRIEEGG